MASQQDKDFRTEIPNIIDDLGLDPHERALYVHYKRSCGGNDCEWTESVRLTAQRTKMSHTRASQARAALVKRGLITVTGKGNDGTAVKVVNVWKINNAYYGYKDGRPSIDGWTIDQLSEWVKGVNNIYTQEPIEPLEPVGVNNMNTSVNNIYNKKEPLEELLPNGNSGKKPPAKAKAKDKEPPPPAAEVYRGITNRYPAKETFPLLVVVGNKPDDLKRWGQTVRDYIACGWNPNNIKGMLDFYQKGELPTTAKNGVHNDKPTTSPAINFTPEQRRRIAEIESQNKPPPDT